MRQIPIESFGKQLILTQDLDPVYVMLNALPMLERKRWCVAYWLYYSAGVASVCVDAGDKFWPKAESYLSSGPRGAERRHFRGAVAAKSIRLFREGFPKPEAFPEHLSQVEGQLSFVSLSKRVRQQYGFGEWLSFKVCDMMERCLQYPILAHDCIDTWYRDPVLGAEMACEEWGVKPSNICSYAEARLINKIGHLKAPPHNDRLINSQEVETVLCKWKSHRHGHYYIGKDTKDVNESLQRFPGGTSFVLQKALAPLVSQFRLL